jgi:hypothetical protein
MGSISIRSKWISAALLALPILAIEVWAQQTTTLLVSGQPGEAKVIQVQGRNYVDVEGIARITSGSLSFSGAQIVLTLPGASPNSSATPPAPGFSRAFMRAGIEAMSEIREWRVALRNAIQRNYPISEDWLSAYSRQAQESIRLAGAAASTDPDKNTVPFLNNEFNNMNTMSQNYLKVAQSMSLIRPDALANDPLDQKILTCARSLSAMVSSNQFVDDGSCH